MTMPEKEWFIEAPWGRISIVAWGSCLDPPVLLVHGQQDSAASFRPLVQMLPQNFYYIGMELPGSGKSDPFPPGLMINVLDLLYPVEVVRRHFRWETFAFMGHSIGCTIGRMYQLTYPNRVSKVVEIDQVTSLLVTEPENFKNWYDKFFTSYYERYDEFNKRKEKNPTFTWDQAIEQVCRQRGLSRVAARATLERCTEPADERNQTIRYTSDRRLDLITRLPLSSSHLKSLYSKITAPTLAFISTESIKNGGFDKTPFLLKENELENYKVLKIEGNHDAFIIKPELLASTVSQFLLFGLKGVESKAKL